MLQTVEARSSEKVLSQVNQYSTFYIGGRLYGIDVTLVQEIVKPLPMTPIPLADNYVRGLINLRGQVATAIGLRELFGLTDAHQGESMNVVCKLDGLLVALQADEIGDVVEVALQDFESTPQTLPANIKQFLSGIYKVPDALLSIIDVDKIYKFLNQK